MPLRVAPLLVLFLNFAMTLAAAHTVSSPNGRLVVTVDTTDGFTLGVTHDDTPVLIPAPIALLLNDGTVLDGRDQTFHAQLTSHDRTFAPTVRQKSAEIRDHHYNLLLQSPTLDLEIRVFNHGFGYRFITRRDGELLISDETLPLRFPAGTRSYFPEEESLMSHNERAYLDLDLASISTDRFASTPVLFTTPAGIRVLFTDADLFDYPGMFVHGTGDYRLDALLPPYPLAIEPDPDTSPDRNVRFTEVADYVARTTGHRSFPWRAFVITRDDRDLLQSELVWLLSRETTLTDLDWIQPGRVAWDWYNANLLTGVDFESGINDHTYRFYIDFAAQHGLEYVILDEGWSASTTNLFESRPEIDVPGLVAYGAARGVGIILWALNEPLARDLPALLDRFASWGARGIKVDFMQRNDQRMVQFYEDVARETAARQMLVDFHGAFKPAGLRRAYPNVISYEGVKGAENNKWSADITPRHNVTIPFIRMVAGPMDYTPGAMRNAHPINHHISFERPVSIGTRCHEIAKFVVFESPLQMLCDSPSAYLAEPVSTAFISRIPSVWDETRVISACLAEHVLIARRSGDTWFVGGMTNENARQLELPLDFLGPSNYTATIMRDGPNAPRHAEDHQQITRTVAATDTLTVPLIANGGWAAIFSPTP